MTYTAKAECEYCDYSITSDKYDDVAVQEVVGQVEEHIKTNHPDVDLPYLGDDQDPDRDYLLEH